MKWAFYIVIFVYMFYRAVYGLKVKENHKISVDTNNDDSDQKYITAGERKVINCKGPSNNQKIEWINPNGQVVSRQPSSRVYVAQHMGKRNAGPSLVLTIGSAAVNDTGIWLCRSGNLVRNVSVCVIDPTEFENTPDEVSVDEGRSFTLSCQAKGEPEPRITWSRNGIEINDDYTDKNKYRVMMKYNREGIEGLLTITSLTTEDSGVYTCNAIQESQVEMEDCSNMESFNITLNINHAPAFEKEDAKQKVYGEEGATLLIQCEAKGYPLPKYHWFKKTDIGLFAFPEKDIIVSDNGIISALEVKVTKDTYTEQYICRASNDLGEKEMTFIVLEPMAPEKPSLVEPVNSTDKAIIFNITWDEEIFFDIHEVDVQYLRAARLPRKRFPKESDWRSAKKSTALISDIFDFGTMVLLSGLEETTEYWVRLRLKNNVGTSAWSAAVLAITEEKNEEQEEENGESGETKSSDSEDDLISTATPVTTPTSMENSGKFYGFFFAGGVLLIAVACTLVAKMV